MVQGFGLWSDGAVEAGVCFLDEVETASDVGGGAGAVSCKIEHHTKFRPSNSKHLEIIPFLKLEFQGGWDGWVVGVGKTYPQLYHMLIYCYLP